MALTKRNITIIDGYNVINAWPELKELAKQNLEDARLALIEDLAEYMSMSGEEVTIVFDAYNLDRPKETIIEKYGMKIVYTKRFQTADTYIEKQILSIGRRHNLKIVTDDGQIQILAASKGASRMTSTELKADIFNNQSKIKRKRKADFNRNFKSFPLSNELIEKIDQMKKDLESD